MQMRIDDMDPSIDVWSWYHESFGPCTRAACPMATAACALPPRGVIHMGARGASRALARQAWNPCHGQPAAVVKAVPVPVFSNALAVTQW